MNWHGARVAWTGCARAVRVALIGITLVGLAAVPAARAQDGGAASLFSKAKIRIEFNASANDVGVQVNLDGEPWKHVRAFSPRGERILDITSRSRLGRQGLTELFFESSEPSLDELPLRRFLARFPAGVYEFEGEKVNGDPIEGEAILTHVIPAGPRILSPVSPTADPPVVDPDAVVISWAPVTATIDGSTDIVIVAYQLIVEQEDPLRVFSVDLPASQASVTVPSEFLESGTEYKLEVQTIEASGNQTISEITFRVS
jgi:hypothetical protein